VVDGFVSAMFRPMDIEVAQVRVFVLIWVTDSKDNWP
jgi:hypothetical protein